MKNKKRYKLQAGVQYATPDTPDIKPDYSDAYALQQKKNAERQGITQAAGAFSGAYKPIADVGSMAGNVIRSNNKSQGGAVAGGAVEMGATGAALGMQVGGPWGAAIGAGAGAIYGGVTGSMEYKKGKKLQEQAERDVALTNANKKFKETSNTSAQSYLAKKGKYKLRTGTSTFKQPRMIETEGREPIFSPEKADGTRDLLYYNPNDPTHEEGGVKAMVMPKAQFGKRSTVAQSSSTSVARPIVPKINTKFKPILEAENKALKQDITNKDKSLKNYKKVLTKRQNFLNVDKEQNNLLSELDDYKKGMSPFKKWEGLNFNSVNDFLETAVGREKDMSQFERNTITRKSLDKWKEKNLQEDPLEDAVEIFDRYGVTSWDDVRRKHISNEQLLKKDPNAEVDKLGFLFEVASAIPGGKYIPFKGTAAIGKKVFNKVTGVTKKASDIGEKVFTPVIGTFNKAKKLGKKYSNKALNLIDEVSDYSNLITLYDKLTEGDKKSNRSIKDLIQEKAYGAKQLKVNTLNNAALSSNLTGMPAVNAANKFIQPTAGISQVARNIPEARRKEKKNTTRSHKTANPDTNRIIDPPMLYEMKPPAPRSTFNTKNDFKTGGKYVKVYQAGSDGTEAESTHKHTKRFNNRQKYEEALKIHNDSLALHGQSRFFEDAVNSTRKYHPTVETSKEVTKYKRTGVSKGPDPNIDPRPFDYKYGSENNWGDPQAPGFERAFSKDIHPIKTNTYTRKESTYKSESEYNKKKNPNAHAFYYNIDMYKHPEMYPVYEADTISNLKNKKVKLQIPKDTTPVTRPMKPVIVTKTPEIKVPVEKIATDTTATTPTPAKVVKPAARGKFLGKEKTGLQKIGEKANQFLNKIGSSKRKSNGKTVRVFK